MADAGTGLGVILVSGVPGSGKSTVSRLLAARFERSVHIEGDYLGHGLIVRGLVAPQEEPQEEARRQLVLRRRNVCLLAESFHADGFLPIVDDVIVDTPVLDRYLELLRTRPLRLIQLAPALDVIAERDAGRDKQVFDTWHHLYELLHDHMPRIGLWIDTSEMTAEATVDAILEHLDAAVIDG